ncbi:hypothetical protein LENED_007514 [Lentinula edodes]|uniref:Uncharacterized protein n=1 Tax=Lentinula edodes TaxID=5353 RepID=A0A1Q3EEJ9_LENED|nr:hypothetical protein LENED_007514 [Lentinula edodes]
MLSAEGFRVQQFVLATHKQGRGWCILRCITSAVFEKKVNNIMSFVIEGFYLSQVRTPFSSQRNIRVLFDRSNSS